ncbi:hydrolase [Ktedonobacter sp. SOSP1-85]|uniref:Cof-type HAD-IIB family hydrolase n=1 Tax=Ktedonobacter sp. SOSP1-85 TaxID=2778367 RepID=UPI001916C7D8|nr:HAD family hydrolase [Ktedonobacter sp. SOSP1-85]GHO77366.1 hydrolase [Ktedonobacter sp. SOSP1-85]
METFHIDTALSSLKLVATDLDGTLLRSDKTISAQTGMVLRRLQATGVALVLISARPSRTLRQIARTYEIGGLALCCNGAILYDLDQDRSLGELALSPQQVQDLVSCLRTALPDLSFAAESGLSVTCEEAFYPFCAHDSAPFPRIVESATILQAPQIKIMTHHASLTTEELYKAVLPLLDAREYSVTYSGAPFLEIARTDVHKGEALATLCAQLEIPAHAVVAFGDMPNDLPLLQWAGLGVAVANAHPLVLQAADAITLSNDEDGVAHLLTSLLSHHYPSVEV